LTLLLCWSSFPNISVYRKFLVETHWSNSASKLKVADTLKQEGFEIMCKTE
jgi:hypothetical protein